MSLDDRLRDEGVRLRAAAARVEVPAEVLFAIRLAEANPPRPWGLQPRWWIPALTITVVTVCAFLFVLFRLDSSTGGRTPISIGGAATTTAPAAPTTTSSRLEPPTTAVLGLTTRTSALGEVVLAPTDATAGTTTTSSVEPTALILSSSGGSIGVTQTADGLALNFAAPRPGYTTEVLAQTALHIEVRFSSATSAARIVVDLTPVGRLTVSTTDE